MLTSDEILERRRLRELLYAAIVELAYIESLGQENSLRAHKLCASSNGKWIIETGMKLLGVKDLWAEVPLRRGRNPAEVLEDR